MCYLIDIVRNKPIPRQPKEQPMNTMISHFGGTGGYVAYRRGNELAGPGGGPAIGYMDGPWIWQGGCGAGSPQFYCDGRYVRAGGENGPVVFNIMDQGTYISIGDGMGQSHFLSTDNKSDPVALAAAACAFLGDMRLRNTSADIVDASTYEGFIRGDAYDNNVNFGSMMGGNVPWSDRRVPEDLRAKYGEDPLPSTAADRSIDAKRPIGKSILQNSSNGRTKTQDGVYSFPFPCDENISEDTQKEIEEMLRKNSEEGKRRNEEMEMAKNRFSDKEFKIGKKVYITSMVIDAILAIWVIFAINGFKFNVIAFLGGFAVSATMTGWANNISKKMMEKYGPYAGSYF
jgi:hypothetical protein